MNRTQRRRRGIAAVTLITAIAVAVPAVATAATAPLQAARGGATHALSDKKVAFSLPDRFTPARSINTNATLRGAYDHDVTVGATVCSVRLWAVGTLQRSRPSALDVAKFWGAGRFNLTSKGTTKALRWYVGRAGYDRIAYAYGPAPKSLATTSRRYVVYKMLLASAVTENAATCDTAVTDDAGPLSAAIRSVHVQNA